MLVTLPPTGFVEALEQSLSVGGHPEKECGLLQFVVVRFGQQHGTTAKGSDLHRLAVLVHLLDQREQALPGLARRHSHVGPFSRSGTRYRTIRVLVRVLVRSE